MIQLSEIILSLSLVCQEQQPQRGQHPARVLAVHVNRSQHLEPGAVGASSLRVAHLPGASSHELHNPWIWPAVAARRAYGEAAGQLFWTVGLSE